MKKIYLMMLFALSCILVNAQAYSTSTVMSGLQYPVAFDVTSDGRFFITEKGDGSNTSSQKSRVRIYSGSGTLIGTFYELSDSTNSDGERGVLGIALDPDFNTNHFVYVYYNHLRSGDERIRIVRFTESSNVGTNPLVIFDLDVANTIPGNHVGGNLHFRPSQPGQIYFTIGDLGYNQTNATLNFANKLNNPYGKLLRINKNGTIPTDNPFYDNGDPLTTNCDWIWSYGHRNPFDFCFGPLNDSLYCSENGLNTWDEANLIRKGAYYGWAECEGNYLNSSTTATCNIAGAVAPITTWGAPVPSVTGILFYSGTVWNSLNNHLLVADNNNGKIYDCTLGNPPAYSTVTTMTVLGDFTTGGLTALKQSSDGCVYAMDGGYTTNGKIYKICSLTTGMAEANSSASSLHVYPNPAKTHLTIEVNAGEHKELQLQLIDIYGKTITTENILSKPETSIISLDLRKKEVSGGIYFIELKDTQTKQVLESVKIVVE
ncbi:MAG: PQQ-dependent sugar dehydrogenase [Bacteroidota bacterium]